MLLGGYDVIYDTIGTQKTIHNALRWARAKATVVLVGLSLHMMHIDLTPVWYQEINLVGTLGQGMETWPLGSETQRSTFSITSDLIMHNVLQPEQLITHHFALNNYRQALLTAIDKRNQRAIKVVFDYSLLPASVVPNVRASARHRRQATVDIRMTSPLTTKDLSQKEPALPLSEHPVTPMPLPAPSFTPEPPPRIVPAPLEPQATPVGTDVARPLALDEQIIEVETPTEIDSSLPNEQEQPLDKEPVDSRETATVSPTPTVTTEAEHVGETVAVSLPPFETQDVEQQAAPVGTNVSGPTHLLTQDEDALHPSLQAFDEEPLNELEWLDVISAEQDMPEVHYVPDVADAPPLPEEAWSEAEPVPYDDDSQESQEKDLAQEVDVTEEPHADEGETETNTPIETLLTTRTSKAINPSRQHSKNRHKGKKITGSFRS